MILQFTGEYRWLSNFSPVEVTYDGIIYPSVEHAYQAAKHQNNDDWIDFVLKNSAGEVKRASKTMKVDKTWKFYRTIVMLSLLNQKFKKEPYHTKLLETGDVLIQEGNTWGDKFWGVDLKTGIGDNVLGKLIMGIRENLKSMETCDV